MKEWAGKAIVENIPQVVAFVDGQLEALDCPMKVQIQIDVAIDEIFSNISNYAYGEAGGDVSVRLSFDETERMFAMEFSDRGIPFNPLDIEEPDVTLGAEERKIGGLGIFLVRKTMNEVAYRYEDGQNILTIRKKI